MDLSTLRLRFSSVVFQASFLNKYESDGRFVVGLPILLYSTQGEKPTSLFLFKINVPFKEPLITTRNPLCALYAPKGRLTSNTRLPCPGITW